MPKLETKVVFGPQSQRMVINAADFDPEIHTEQPEPQEPQEPQGNVEPASTGWDDETRKAALENLTARGRDEIEAIATAAGVSYRSNYKDETICENILEKLDEAEAPYDALYQILADIDA